MPLEITRYELQHEAAVAEFNERARSHSAPFTLSKTATAAWLPKRDGRTLFREYFLALEGGAVRGGFTLRRQDFWLRGEVRRMANYQGPLAEGIWDRRYMMAGVQMLRAALREESFLYALGMGGPDQPLPKLLTSAGWSIAPVPFLFKVLRASPFLRHIRPLRGKKGRAGLMDFAAATGLGALAVHTIHWLRTKSRLPSDCACEPVSSYGAWADQIWESARDSYEFTAVRDRTAQDILFGDANARNITLRCTRDGGDIGWAVVRSTPMRDDKYFGGMRVGSIVDCLALPGQEFSIVELATRHLRALGSDIVVTNQTHARWIAALRDDGYLGGPSNFLFAASPKLAEALGPLETALGGIHFNRADGDGPIHL